MNKDRRKRIEEALVKLEEIKDEITAITEEEQEAFDNMPEGLQSSVKGEAMQSAIDALSEAESDLDSVISQLQGIE